MMTVYRFAIPHRSEDQQKQISHRGCVGDFDPQNGVDRGL